MMHAIIFRGKIKVGIHNHSKNVSEMYQDNVPSTVPLLYPLKG